MQGRSCCPAGRVLNGMAQGERSGSGTVLESGETRLAGGEIDYEE